jgi:hypothetical protein
VDGDELGHAAKSIIRRTGESVGTTRTRSIGSVSTVFRE